MILPEQSCKLGRLVDRVTVVHDLTNVSLAMLTPLVIGFIKQLTAIDAVRPSVRAPPPWPALTLRGGLGRSTTPKSWANCSW